MLSQSEPLDVAIIGGGICGIISLHYARLAKLTAHVFEKEGSIGGLWGRLPTWQDLQIGVHDWALGELTLASPFQPDVLRNIESWVERFHLADGITLNCAVRSARREHDLWVIETPAGRVRARHLVAATGAHNLPYIPAVRRNAASLREYHSSELRDPSELNGRRVLVVGGGASAFDLLDLCFAHRAASVAWAHRNVRWMTPGRKPKHVLGSVRGFGRLQMSGATAAEINAGLDFDLRGRYEKFGIQSILPRGQIDLGRHQLIPARPLMLQNFHRIQRFHAGVEDIRGSVVTLSSGDEVDTDVLLWGTGYEVDLSWLTNSPLSSIRSLNELNGHCGGLCMCLDEPNLYFPAIGLDGVGTATWSYALVMRTLTAHIAGGVKLDREPLPQRLNHFDLVRYLAARDPVHFPPEHWEAEYTALANTPDGEPFPLPQPVL